MNVKTMDKQRNDKAGGLSPRILCKDKLAKSIVLSAAAAVMFCVFEPLQLYFTNIEEYWFDIYNLFPVCMLMFAGVFAASMAGFFFSHLIHYRLWEIAYVVYGIAFVCSYIQGNYLAGNLPFLDGGAVDWTAYDGQRIYTVILWVAVSLLAVILLWKKKITFTIKVFAGAAGMILAVLVVTCVITGFSHNGLMDKGDLTVTGDKFMSLSRDGKNYIILLLDSVNGEEMSELLENDPEVREGLKDFTYYDNTVVGYPMTFHSIYYLLSGDWYECDELIKDYQTNVLLHAPLFDELEKRDYAMEFYSLVFPYPDDDGFYRFDNLKRAQGTFASYWKFIKLEMRLVGLRYAPYDLKRFCLALPGEFDDLKVVKETDGELFTYENRFFIRQLKNEIEYIPGNDFKFIHMDGAHSPYIYNKYLEELSEETDYHESVQVAAAMAVAYVKKLKEAGVYDNTALIILSDHGYNCRPYEENLPFNPEDRQQGVLFIKGFGEQHDELEINNAPIAHGDLQGAYMKLMDGCRGDEIFPFQEGEKRERRFLWHSFDNNIRLIEYMQTGQAGDMDTLIETGRVYEWPDGLVSE